MYRLPPIQPLSEIRPITPSRAFQAGKERRMLEDYNKQRMELTQMQLQEYQEGALQRDLAKKVAAIEGNTKITDYMKESLAYIDPKSPDFDAQVATALTGLRGELVEAGFTDEEADQYVKTNIIDKGMASRGAIATIQKQLGLVDEAAKPELDKSTGQQFTIDPQTGMYKASPVEGYEEKPKDTPKTAMEAFLQQKPNATPEELATFSQQLKGKGMRVVLPDGTVMEMGGSADMTTKTKGEIEGKILGGKEALARISSIKNEFKPEYQEIGARFANLWTGIKAKLGQDVPKEDANKLTEFKAYQRKSIENINLYIKELTGAQMSEKEATRLRLAQPDPGEKWYQGDDPITFKAKMDDIEKYSRAAIARYEYYKSKGLSDKQIEDLVNEGSVVSLDSLVSKMK